MRIRSSFICSACGRETPHELHQTGSVLHEIRCLTCSRESFGTHHPIGPYARELRERIASKPGRTYAEIAELPTNLLTLPKRVTSKPLRVACELVEIMR